MYNILGRKLKRCEPVSPVNGEIKSLRIKVSMNTVMFYQLQCTFNIINTN